ncbi:MAG: MurT ligase domain-containing protein [Oscillospiraceae bacterium]|nr:MurT ligase domain-containing protein [Oscillospiraceae bacterium]
MRRLRVILAILVCKAARWGLRVLGRGGTSVPGKLALRVCPDLLGALGRQVYTIVITGTNGKTTSARMLEQCLENGAIPAFANRSGANLLPGITAEFVAHATISGKMRLGHAIIECDEAAFRLAGPYLDAKVVLVTNVFRDQLDRFGEITHTLNSIRAGIEYSPNATVCINADCALCVGMVQGLPNPIRYFGVETALFDDGEDGMAEMARCPACSTAVVYDYKTYGHLGGYGCPDCAFTRPKADVAVTAVLEELPDTVRVEVQAGGERRHMTINLPGAYNIYNAAGVIAVAEVLNLGMSVTAAALAEFRGGFGRMERLNIGDVTVRMILVKNPIGCSQVLRYLGAMQAPMTLVICLNDRSGDGADVSWIWDVDAEILGQMGERLHTVYCSGIRADEVAVWMKYAGVDEGKIQVEHDTDKLLESVASSSVPVYVMPTYTAMLEVREKLAKQYGLSQFWE